MDGQLIVVRQPGRPKECWIPRAGGPKACARCQHYGRESCKDAALRIARRRMGTVKA